MQNGIDKLFFQSGNIAFTKLNEALSVNHTISIGIGFRLGK